MHTSLCASIWAAVYLLYTDPYRSFGEKCSCKTHATAAAAAAAAHNHKMKAVVDTKL